MQRRCSHSVVLICDGYTQCRDCEHIEKSAPCTFEARPLSEDEQRAILGDELYEAMQEPARGYCTVTKIG